MLGSSVTSSSGSSSQAAAEHQQTAATNAYGEPIKWSFGGWAPLDGQQPGARRQNQTTTPLPPMEAANPHRTTATLAHPAKPFNRTMQQQAPNGRRASGDSMSESASSSHGKLQFVAPQRHHSGPAYALSMQRPAHFSPPAPMPIVREHLLPAAASNFQRELARGSLGPHYLPHRHANRMQQQHHQQMMVAAAQQYPRPPVSLHEHQRRLEQQHRQQQQQQMMRHHQMMMRHQRGHGPGAQITQQQQPPQYQAGQEAMSGHQPARPAQQPPMIEGYRVVEGEHPILFSPPSGMMELAPAANHSKQLSATSQAPYASAMAAIDKDNLGYQSALRQVNSEGTYAEQQSNNIQDIKQKQQQQQQQQQEHHKPGSYLTIPVAVETEGDKVLTADDINEIQKHVIQVLPNLKTADKVVKLADTKLTLASANLKDAIRQVGASVDPTAALHQLNYEEHRSTMKQLENDLSGAIRQTGGRQQYESPTTSMPSSPPPSTAAAAAAYPASGAYLNQATTNAHVQHQQPKSIDDGQPEPGREHLNDQQYLLAATGPMQEVGNVVDPDQLAEYNLIKNDLLQNFRYEPTRATSSSGSSSQQAGAPQQHRQQQQQQQQQRQQQQTASTPPMPYTASQPPQPHRPASVTRYFQQGNRMYQQHSLEGRPPSASAAHRGNNNNNLFGRIPTPAGRGYGAEMSSTTKTILGGRKVSEVMRNLIHTTPVPMTSPMHVPSVEPEKVDTIQLIASHGNDNKPMVVEPHQLVQHTPEGGFDYGNHDNNSNNHTGGHQQQYEQAQHYRSPAPQMAAEQPQGVSEGQQQQQQQPGGAMIEYVAVGEQALNNALGQHEGTYEISSQPELQPVYQHAGDEQQRQHQDSPSSRAPFVYDYTMSADQQQTGSTGNNEQSSGYSLRPASAQLQGGNAGEPQMFTWSPSIANEHQQQQAELSEHAAPGHQMDMPATAGYNFFGQSASEQQQPPKESGQDYEQQHQQPQHHYQEQQQTSGGKMRTKAGGSQPNPDAQYDGQIVKGASDHQAEQDDAQNSQHSADEQQQQYNGSPVGYEGQSGNEQLMGMRQPEHNQGESADGYQQKQHQQGYQQQQQQQEQQSPTTPANQQVGDGYLATNSYAAGAQFNHQTPSHGNFDQQKEYDQSREQPARYNYVKLDHDRQQSHLAQQQAQRQVQMAEIMNTQQQLYQTTTPLSVTTLASADAQQQRQTGEEQGQQQQQQVSNDYSQDQSHPSVQSSPESMLINESPMSMPILDQQSLISDSNQDSSQELSSDDGAKQTQPATVYQVYQAYYAPKDHKPLPGYVRLSLEEFNELFRDAEIQYVDRNNLNGMDAGSNQRQHQGGTDMQHAYEQAPTSGANQNDLMKASASEHQSIVVDRRSIAPERRSSNATLIDPESSENRPASRRSKFGGAVKKIISIRNSRQASRQQLLKSTILKQHKAQQQQPTKSNLTTASMTTTNPSFSPSTSSNNHPTTKQQPNVSTVAGVTQNQQKMNNKHQLSNKRKSNRISAAATAKKPLIVAQSQPVKAAIVSKDKSKLSAVDGGKRSASATTNDSSGSKTSH